MFTTAVKQKTKNKKYIEQDIDSAEIWREPSKNQADIKNIATDFGKDFLKQLTGLASGVMEAGREIDLTKASKPAENKPAIDPAYNYAREILHNNENLLQNQEVKQQVEGVLIELQKLAGATQELDKAVTQATGQTIVTPGKYHLNFFQWLRSTIQEARLKIQESGMWLQTMNNKQAKKGYWNMQKKHGTSFMLSGERSLSTQTG